MKKMSISSRLCALVLTALAAVSLSACSSPDNSPSSAAASSGSSVSSQGSTSPAASSLPSSETAQRSAVNGGSKVFDVSEGTIDESLLGTWQYAQNSDMTYTFTDKNEMIWSGFGTSQNLLYYVKDGCIYSAANENTYPAKLPYSINGNTLHMNDSLGNTLDYIKVG